MVSYLKQVLQSRAGDVGEITWDAWVGEQKTRGEQVARYRQYADGEHPSYLTDRQKDMLNIEKRTTESPFASNHMEKVINALADRLELQGVDVISISPAADTKNGVPTNGARANVDGEEADPAKMWVDDLLEANRIDALQLEVHDSSLTDADTYLLAEWDNDEKRVRWSHEPAFDGVEGMLVAYGRNNSIALAVKIWREAIHLDKVADVTRVNIYFADRVEKYIKPDGSEQLEPFEVEGEQWPAPWVASDGKPLGVPVAHFRNRRKKHNRFGKSRIHDAIPLQDAINRTLVSMVMNAELSAFMIRYAFGFDPPSDLAPGDWVKVFHKDKDGKAAPLTTDQIEWIKSLQVGVLDSGEIQPYIEEAQFLLDDMYDITNTPRRTGSDAVSGESLKQREIGLVGEGKRSQVSFGNAWEDIVKISHAIQTKFGVQKPPNFRSVNARWKSVELRDDTARVDNAMKMRKEGDISRHEMLRIVAPVFDWNEDRIKRILAEVDAEQETRLNGLVGSLPGFDQFTPPLTPPQSGGAGEVGAETVNDVLGAL